MLKGFIDLNIKKFMMKKRICNYPVVLILLIFQLLNSCKKEEPAQLPVVSTTPATEVTVSTATSGGTITSDGGDLILESGVCWSTNPNPSTSDSKTVDGTAIGQFVSKLTGLVGGTSYHVRAYATNSVGTAYGADISFSTVGKVPASITQPASAVTTDGATLTGTVNPNDLPTTVSFEYGTTTNYGSTVTASQSPVNGNSIYNVNVVITGLTPGTTYHYRIKTVNSIGTTYGSDVTFTTNPIPSTKSGLFTIRTGTDDLYFIDINTLTFTKIADIGLTIESMFMGMQYKDHKLYLSYGAKLYTYDLLTNTLTLLISNTNLAWQFSINSLGELYSVTEITGTTPGSLYKINLSSNTSVRIGGTSTASVWGLGFDASDQLWSVEEFIQRYGTINTATGTFTATSAVIAYTDTYYSIPDNDGNLYSFNVGYPATGIIKFNIQSNSASMLIPLAVIWSGLAFGQY